jgi:hypothetical protein
MTPFAGPYRLVDGTQVASSFDDLIDCPFPYTGCTNLDNPIHVDENGNARGLVFVFSGTFPDGTEDASLTSCSDWTATTNSARSGRSDGTDFLWTACCVTTCNTPAPLYCVEQ